MYIGLFLYNYTINTLIINISLKKLKNKVRICFIYYKEIQPLRHSPMGSFPSQMSAQNLIDNALAEKEKLEDEIAMEEISLSIEKADTNDSENLRVDIYTVIISDLRDRIRHIDNEIAMLRDVINMSTPQ